MRGRSQRLAAVAAAAGAGFLAIASPASAADGTFERTWGKNVDSGGGTGFEICTVAASCQGGSEGVLGGELSSPFGIATDSQGNVYVADISRHRIQKFDSSGTFLRTWGRDVDQGGGTGFEVCTAAASCKAGIQGALGGELSFPQGVATDPQGNVYVVDFFNDRIQKFDSSGTFLRTWGKNVDQTGGTGSEVCVVAASCQAGTDGALGGELANPSSLAADAQGNVYVGEVINQRIQKFDSSGAFLRAWGQRRRPGRRHGL